MDTIKKQQPVSGVAANRRRHNRDILKKALYISKRGIGHLITFVLISLRNGTFLT